jgi:hypothetical protein
MQDTYYIDISNALHFLSAQDLINAQAHGLPLPDPGWTVATTAQVQAIQNPPLTLSQAQSVKIASLVTSYQAAISVPVSFKTAAGVTQTFQADAQSVANVQATLAGLAKAAATPTGFYWVAADNTQVPFTYADVQGLAAAMLAQGWVAFQNLQTKKTAVMAATTVASVQSITW